MRETALFWFGDDLRLTDNAAVINASKESKHLLFVYCVDSKWFQNNRYDAPSMGAFRWHFLKQSLDDLAQQLEAMDQELVVLFGEPTEVISQLVARLEIDAIFGSESSDFERSKSWQQLRQRFPFIHIEQWHSSTLFDPEELPFAIDELPDTFSKFRRKAEKLTVARPISAANRLPPKVPTRVASSTLPKLETPQSASVFSGGERAGKQHVKDYFSSNAASSYKETRNALDEFSSSTKFSPWLANGCVSPRWILGELDRYEQAQGANDSTYWIYFELLWSEYFHWYAVRHGARLFAFAGVRRKKPLTSFYGQRYIQWCRGETPWPIVNACMKQLNQTGYMSNRGRQLVASCLINELQLDWRAGASYFEQQLVDYDVASNWGNWQYIAGVGADPRGGRHFNLKKQTEFYDPKGEFVARWSPGIPAESVDAVDAADWPIMPNS